MQGIVFLLILAANASKILGPSSSLTRRTYPLFPNQASEEQSDDDFTLDLNELDLIGLDSDVDMPDDISEITDPGSMYTAKRASDYIAHSSESSESDYLVRPKIMIWDDKKYQRYQNSVEKPKEEKTLETASKPLKDMMIPTDEIEINRQIILTLAKELKMKPNDQQSYDKWIHELIHAKRGRGYGMPLKYLLISEFLKIKCERAAGVKLQDVPWSFLFLHRIIYQNPKRHYNSLIINQIRRNLDRTQIKDSTVPHIMGLRYT